MTHYTRSRQSCRRMRDSLPGPLLEAKRGMPEVPKKGIMEVLSSDECTNDDIPLGCKKVGHEYLCVVKEKIRQKRSLGSMGNIG